MSSKKEPKAQSPSPSSSANSRRKLRLKKTNTDKSSKQISSSKSTKSVKSQRSGRSKKKSVKKETGLQAEAEASTKVSGQKKEKQASIRRLIPAISPKAFSQRWMPLRGENGQPGNDSNRSRKNAPDAANPSNRQSKIAPVRQSSPKKLPHPQSKEANKNLQPTDKETSYVDRLLNRLSNSNPIAPVSAQPKEPSKKQHDHQTSSRKSRKLNSHKSSKTDSKRSHKKPKIDEPDVEKLHASPSPSKAPSSTPKSQKVVKQAVNAKAPVAAGVKKSPASTSPNTPLLPSAPVRISRRYFYTKDEDPGSIGQSKEVPAAIKTPLNDTPAAGSTTPITTPSPNVDEEEEEKSSDESESERSINAKEVLKQERNTDQKPENLQPVKVIVRPGEPVPIDKEHADRIAKLRANAPKPKPQPKNPKEVKIHEKRIFKKKSDYPTMNDVVSDWDSVDDQNLQNEKKKLQPPKKTGNGQVRSSSFNEMRAFGFQVLLISTFVVLTVLLFFNESSLAYVLINGGGNYKVVVNKSELFLKVQCRHLSYEDFEEEQVTMDVGGCVLELLIKPAEKLPTTQIKSYNDIAPQTPLFVGEQLKFTKQHMLNIHDLPPSSLEFGCATKFERDGETYIVDIKVDGKFPRDYLLYSNNSIVYEESKEEAVDTSTIVFSIVGGLLGIAVVALFGYFIYLCCWRERRENNQTVRQPTVTQQTDKVQESQQNTEQLNNAKKGKQLGDYKNRVIALEEQYNNPGSKQSDVHVKK